MSSKQIKKALEHYELATTHLGIALHLFTEHGNETLSDPSLFVLATKAAGFVGGAQQLLKKLCDAGYYRMPHEALALLANSDPETFLKVAGEVRKERREGAD